jgi:hemerythrin-like metal-binding protein
MKAFSGFLGLVPMMQHCLASRIRWGDHLSIGNPEIDAQKRAIFELVDEIDELCGHGADIVPLRSVADRSRRMLEVHFDCEERMLAEVGYPDLAEHAAGHREILEDLACIRADFDGSDGLHPARLGLRLFNFLLGVTAGHILNADSDYCRYFSDETARLSTGCA